MADKKIAVGLGVAAGVGALLYLATRAKAAPPEPPPPGLANLYGLVTDAETGKVISGVLATLDGIQTYTGGNGNYAFTDLELGGYHIIFEKEGYEMASGDITLVEGNNEVNVAMTPIAPPVARLFGVVTDAETGLPLVGVSVDLFSPDETELIVHTTTNSSGYYLMDNIYPSSYVVYFRKDGYETVTR